jgi:cytochrome c peroxidase
MNKILSYKWIVPITILGLVLMFNSCSREVEFIEGSRQPVLPETVYKYDSLPTVIDFDPFGGVTIDNHKATLGRVLFYETQLSINNRKSCGSCHKQHKAFSDDEAMSIGFHNGSTGRNSPAIVNAGAQVGFFWDLRESALSEMVLKPIAHPVEMGLESQELMVQKLQRLPYYAALFTNAFGDEEITVERISDALDQFIRSVVSINSPFDFGRLNNFSNYTEQEELGRQLFFHKFPCSGCHGGSELNGLANAENVGLDMDYADNGVPGFVGINNEPRDGWFKVPTLRNSEVSGPYMHDGRFNTLEEVVEFYNSGIQPHSQLSAMLRTHEDGGFFILTEEIAGPDDVSPFGRQPLRMHMTAVEKQALVAFMKTLTDQSFLVDERFSDPFVIR